MTSTCPPVVVAQGLTKNYGKLCAVSGIDFEIFKGECFGFLGPNGAGKSTTMQMIYCASTLTGGSLQILGVEAGNFNHHRQIKSHLGVIPQDNNLDLELTVWETLIVFSRFYSLYGQKAARRAQELLQFVELMEKKDAKIGELSGGMRRRVLIARSLINDPKIIILDEPTAGLDPRARQKLWDHLAQLKAQGKTLILTTHYMEEARSLCDRLAIMDGGKIVGQGRLEELVANFGKSNPSGDAQDALENVFLKLTKVNEESH